MVFSSATVWGGSCRSAALRFSRRRPSCEARAAHEHHRLRPLHPVVGPHHSCIRLQVPTTDGESIVACSAMRAPVDESQEFRCQPLKRRRLQRALSLVGGSVLFRRNNAFRPRLVQAPPSSGPSATDQAAPPREIYARSVAQDPAVRVPVERSREPIPWPSQPVRQEAPSGPQSCPFRETPRHHLAVRASEAFAALQRDQRDTAKRTAR
jgi:hypothetical protein